MNEKAVKMAALVAQQLVTKDDALQAAKEGDLTGWAEHALTSAKTDDVMLKILNQQPAKPSNPGDTHASPPSL